MRVFDTVNFAMENGGLFGKRDDIVIPFDDIEKAGSDLILVSYEIEDVELAKRGKKRFFDL